MPILRSLPEDLAAAIFVIIHVPLFSGIIALIATKNDQARSLSRLVISVFLVLHAVLHFWFSSHPNYEFVSTLSDWLIFGGALFGAIYLTLMRQQVANSTVR